MAGKVTVDGRVARPATPLRLGAVVRLELDRRVMEFQVTELRERASQEQARNMYAIIRSERRDMDDLTGYSEVRPNGI